MSVRSTSRSPKTHSDASFPGIFFRAVTASLRVVGKSSPGRRGTGRIEPGRFLHSETGGIIFVDTAMKTRIQKWGNSLALRIPKPFAEEAHLAEDSAVDVTVRNGKIVVVAVEEAEETLETLVAQITPQNRHEETKTGKSVGYENW